MQCSSFKCAAVQATKRSLEDLIDNNPTVSTDQHSHSSDHPGYCYVIGLFTALDVETSRR